MHASRPRKCQPAVDALWTAFAAFDLPSYRPDYIEWIRSRGGGMRDASAIDHDDLNTLQLYVQALNRGEGFCSGNVAHGSRAVSSKAESLKGIELNRYRGSAGEGSAPSARIVCVEDTNPAKPVSPLRRRTAPESAFAKSRILRSIARLSRSMPRMTVKPSALRAAARWQARRRSTSRPYASTSCSGPWSARRRRTSCSSMPAATIRWRATSPVRLARARPILGAVLHRRSRASARLSASRPSRAMSRSTVRGGTRLIPGHLRRPSARRAKTFCRS